MKTSLKWIGQFFPELLPPLDVLSQTEMIREMLPLAGIEIGGWKKLGEGIDGVVVAQIVSFAKHPQADRLNVCQVSDGEKTLQIVCGAPNVKAGVKVALAPIGTTLPNGLKIKAAVIRGVESSGMLCSEKELGLSEEGQGILHLPDSAPLGSPLTKALGLNDQIWEVELTPDRADCLSHFGLAREVGRILSVKPMIPEFDLLNPADSSDVPLLSVEVQATKACPIYGAQLFEGLTNRPSPEWLRRLLESLGHRSHNALVDITNYVLLELGHPLHAFDADKIAGARILVRFAKNGEKLKTLDGEVRTLTTEDLVIADLEKPLALAGVMGGLDSGVTESTKRVVLEAALFDPQVVRAMAQRHKIHSEASHRFERGVDPANCSRAAGRASLLIRQLTGGRRRGSFVEIRSERGEKALQKFSFNFDLRAIKDVVGIDTTIEEVTRALIAVDIDAQSKSTNVLRVEIPTHRLDLTREIDLVEEIARLLGYDRIPLRYPPQGSATNSMTTHLYQKLRQVRHRFLETGLTEMMPYSFISTAERRSVPGAPMVEIKNPLSADWQFMRPNLFFGLVKVLTHHATLGQLSGGFFDSGSVFSTIKKEGASERATGVEEDHHAAWALMGTRTTEHWSSDKKASDRKAPVDFFDGKGVAEAAIAGLSALEPRWSGTQFVSLADFPAEELSAQAPWIPAALLHPGRSALMVWPGKLPGKVVGFVGELHPQQKTDLLNLPTGLQLGVVFGEVRCIPDLWGRTAEYASPVTAPRGKIVLSRKFPVVERDLAFKVKSAVKAADLDQALRRAAGAELVELQCVDVFQLPDQEVSLAYRLSLQADQKTFTDEEIGVILRRIIEAARAKCGAELRS